MVAELPKLVPDRVAEFLATLKAQQIEYVRFELPDLHGMSRLKIVPIDKVEAYTRKGLNFYGGTLALDTASKVVPGSGLHEERNYRDRLLFPDLDSLTIVPWSIVLPKSFAILTGVRMSL